MVICGATGDLTERKLAPALYNLMLGGFLRPEFTVVGFARRELTNEQFSAHLLEGVNKYSRNKPAKASIWESFARGIEYHRGDLDDPTAYAELGKRLDRIDRDRGTAGNRLFYLAVPPSLYPDIVQQLHDAGLAATGAARSSDAKRGWTRVIIEKPFGYDLASARTLNQAIGARLRRGPGLPHRPLPGEGDRPEPRRLPLRKRALRADLESPLHRQRPDHGGRDGRGRRAAASSTTRPARCATSCRTTACSCWPSSAWSRRSRSRRRTCATRS